MQKIKGFFYNYHTFAKIIILFFLVLFFVSAGMLFFIIPAITINTKIQQLILSLCMFVIPSLLFAFLVSHHPSEYLHIHNKITLTETLLVVIFMFLSIPVVNLAVELNQRLILPEFLSGVEKMLREYETAAAKLTKNLLIANNLYDFAGNILIIALIPALGEELFFRGVVLRLSGAKNIKRGIWITAIIFSAAHMQFYGFFPRMLLGAFFGYLVVWSNSLWPAVIAHFTNNATTVIYYFLQSRYSGIPDIDAFGTKSTLGFGIAGIFVTVLSVYFLRYFYKKRKNQFKTFTTLPS